MRNLTATICLTIAVLLGNAAVFWGAEAQEIDSINKSERETQNLIQYPTLNITNYPSSIHGGVRATWGITQAQDGRMYFANTHGILVYDGESWRSIETKGAELGRSITTDSDGYIIAGTVGDIGVIQSDKTGRISFKSLLNSSDENIIKTKTTIYEILPIGPQSYLMRTKSALYKYSSKGLEKLKTPSEFRFNVATKIDGIIYIYVYKKGLFTLINEVLTKVIGTEQFTTKSKTINGVLKHNGNLILVTARSGVYHLKDGVSKKIIYSNPTINRTKIYRAISLRDGRYALATYDGIFILDTRLKITHHIALDTGLLTNNVRSLYQDSDGSLWAGLNDGISKITINQNLRFFEKDISRINAIVNGVSIFNGELYIATSEGLKKSKIDQIKLRQTFIPIYQDILRTQTWSILRVGEDLFVGSNYGMGRVDKKGNYNSFIEKKNIGSVYNLKHSKLFKDHILVGSRKGLGLVNAMGGKNIYRKIPLSDKGAVWKLIELAGQQEVWAIVGSKGLYRVRFSDSSKLGSIEFVKKYSIADGLPNKTLRRTTLFTINGDLLIGTRNGVYKFVRGTERFVQDDRFSILPSYKTMNVVVAKKINDKIHWVGFENNSSGVRKQELYKITNDFTFKKLPLDRLLKFSRLNLFPYKEFSILSGTEGMAVIRNDITVLPPTGKTLVTELKVNDITLYERAPLLNFSGEKFRLKYSFSHKQNKISVVLAATDYQNEKRNRYRYRLINFENTWNITASNEITYTNLNPGKYIFAVQSINTSGQNLLPFEYNFTINPPWWQTTYFYVAEILFFLVLLFFTLLIKQNTRVEKLATALTFVVIIIIFEYANMLLDPLIIELTGGVPVFALLSKVVLGIMLQPTERITSASLDWCSRKISKTTVS